MTYSGIWAAGTRAINGYNVDGSVPANHASIDGLIESLARYNQDDCVDRYDGANPFAKLSYPAATRAVDWMTDCGVGFMPLGMYEGAFSAGFTSYFAPGIYMGGAGYALMAMAHRLEKLPNAEVKYMVKATELIQDETGRVTGVKAQGLKSDDSPNGYELTVNAKAVVLATGSYALNRELLEEYEPRFADQTYHCCSASTGDGHQMALKAGSKMECTGIQFPAYPATTSFFEIAFIDVHTHCCSASTGDGHQMALKAGSKMECTGIQFPAYPATTSFFEIAFIDVHTPLVTVNGNGGFIGRTGTSHADLSMALLDENNGGRFFCVLDASAEPTLRYLVNGNGGFIGRTGTSHADLSMALLDENNGGRFFCVLDASAEPTLRYLPSMGYRREQRRPLLLRARRLGRAHPALPALHGLRHLQGPLQPRRAAVLPDRRGRRRRPRPARASRVPG